MINYEPRIIKFKENVELADWSVKVYSITRLSDEDWENRFKYVKSRLHEWLIMDNSFNSSNDQIAFLIIHTATEGVFSIINWWVGKNMLNTHIFLSPHDQPEKFKLISGDGLSPCVWELEVINHERKSWMKHILKKPNSPDYNAYMNDHYTGIV